MRVYHLNFLCFISQGPLLTFRIFVFFKGILWAILDLFLMYGKLLTVTF